jgi:DNA-binding CsgD family transcriptional regulator
MAEADAPGLEDQWPLSGPLPFVGRAREVSELEALIEAPDHTVAAALVSGEPGVGRSRLVSEVAAGAEARGWRVVRGRAYPAEAGVPYALFADAFLPLLREIDEATLTVLSRGGRAELNYLFPALSDGPDEAPTDPSADPGEFRTRLTWNFAEFLKNYVARTPVLVVLEDIHWGDDSSLQLIHFLTRQAARHRLFILATYRSSDRERTPHIAQIEHSLGSDRIGVVQQLAPLGSEAVVEVVCRTFGVAEAAVQDFCSLLFRRTKGSPFFVEEVLKALVKAGRLRRLKDTWIGWDAKELEIPQSVREVVVAQVASLSDPARVVLEAATIIGSGAPYGLLRVATGFEDGDLLAALEELCSNRILVESEVGDSVSYGFALPIVQDTLYRDFGLQKARILHGQVAQALEVFGGDRVHEYADELAYHFSRTDPSELGGKAVQYLAAAGRAALNRHADREAADYLRAAIKRSPPGGEGPPRTELLSLLARAYRRVGEYDEAISLWTEVLADLPVGSPKSAEVLLTLGLTNFAAGHHKEAFARLDEGLDITTAANDDSAVVRTRLVRGHCLQATGRGVEAQKEVESALIVAERVGDPRLLAKVHRSLTLLHVWLGPPEKVLRHADVALPLASQTGDAVVAFWVHWGLAVLSGMRGETGPMVESIEAAADLADQLRSPVLKLWTKEISIELAYAQGEWDRGIALGERSIELARDLSQDGVLARLLALTSLFYVGRGADERARALVDEALQLSRDNGAHEAPNVHQVVPSYIGLAHYLVGTGDYDGAIDAARNGLRIAEGTGYTLWALHRLLPILAEACLWAERVDEAEEVGVRLREHSETLDHRLGLAWADTCDAMVCWKRGDPDKGASMLIAAAEALERIPMIPYAARVRRQLAGRLADIGDREGALRELRAVHDTFSALGAEGELQAARAQFRELGQRPPQRKSGAGMAGLTGRELEIARLVAARKSNKAVGKALGISPRTVSTHLSHIYHKLGVGTRGELTDLIRAQSPPEA